MRPTWLPHIMGTGVGCPVASEALVGPGLDVCVCVCCVVLCVRVVLCVYGGLHVTGFCSRPFSIDPVNTSYEEWSNR